MAQRRRNAPKRLGGKLGKEALRKLQSRNAKVPALSFSGQPNVLRLARAGTQRGPRGERTRAHAQLWQGRRNGTQGIAAIRATPVGSDVIADVCAHPAPARFAHRVDALHRKTGQVLHLVFPQHARRVPPPGCGPKSLQRTSPKPDQRPQANERMMGRIVERTRLVCQAKRPLYLGVPVQM